jgi:hypothetical protein
MGGKAGYKALLQVDTGGASFVNVSMQGTDITTDFDEIDSAESGSAQQTRDNGLRTSNMTLSFFPKVNGGSLDAGQKEIIEMLQPATSADFKYFPDGVVGNGYKIKFIIKGFEHSGETRSQESISVQLQSVAGSITQV